MFRTFNESLGDKIFKIQSMAFLYSFKSTVFIWFLALAACGNQPKQENKETVEIQVSEEVLIQKPIVVAANRTGEYLPKLKGKSVGIIANQTSVIFKNEGYTHLVDSLLSLGINIKKVFAPEHGFRGKGDAGEKIKDDVDTKTGLPLISLHGKTRKPTTAHLKDIDVLLFDIQDVGVRFYTYIATLQLAMEASGENEVPIIVLDRPNPNAHYIDGPSMEAEHTGFLGMTEIPLVYGMTIGEYAQMINEEGWLAGKRKANLTVIELANWSHQMEYSVPIRPSPNLPNDTSIFLYPSLGLFEGTNINAGRGTEFQFQRYGASLLDSTQYNFSYIPQPNFGSKTPKENGEICFGKNLTEIPRMKEVSLQWLLDAYQNATNKSEVFNKSGFTKHAGTKKLQEQIESGMTEEEIKDTWQSDIDNFKKIRANYLLYAE